MTTQNYMRMAYEHVYFMSSYLTNDAQNNVLWGFDVIIS